MLYKQIIKFFSRDTAYRMMLLFLRLFRRIRLYPKYPSLALDLLDIHLSGPIALGPGLDKDGSLVSPISNIGFSIVAVGPVNGQSVRNAIPNLKNRDAGTKVSLCINRDYSTAMFLAYDFVDAFLLEIPDSEIIDTLEQILDLRLTYDTYKPIFLRITHDMPDLYLKTILDFSMMNGVDGFEVAKVENVRKVCTLTKGHTPIIGYGGIRSYQDAQNMFDAGATLVSVTTGLVLDGPGIAHNILKQLDFQLNVNNDNKGKNA